MAWMVAGCECEAKLSAVTSIGLYVGGRLEAWWMVLSAVMVMSGFIFIDVFLVSDRLKLWTHQTTKMTCRRTAAFSSKRRGSFVTHRLVEEESETWRTATMVDGVGRSGEDNLAQCEDGEYDSVMTGTWVLIEGLQLDKYKILEGFSDISDTGKDTKDAKEDETDELDEEDDEDDMDVDLEEPEPKAKPKARSGDFVVKPKNDPRMAAIPLYARDGQVKRQVARPKPFAEMQTTLTNNLTQNVRITDRVNKAWGYNVGAGPL
ncbi:hypothetical protein ARMSODRAFT_1011253 [Armillaria solidipes]|uniref:Uncharacterized protein n=1 Tax=Armillaria solidipes TaxID=1076256 RepID=A0A2H3C6K5_9AGAR|nr:hypothetical protein ARMSODRAFT_1011253 [Armillaria solidipes]